MPQRRHCRPARTHAAVLIFLVGFAVFLVFLSSYYLIPAARTFIHARQEGDKVGVHAIRATSSLLLSVLLVVLVGGLFLTVRIGRFFFPRGLPPRTKTKYVDVWAESGRRMQTPPDDQGEES